MSMYCLKNAVNRAEKVMKVTEHFGKLQAHFNTPIELEITKVKNWNKFGSETYIKIFVKYNQYKLGHDSFMSFEITLGYDDANRVNFEEKLVEKGNFSNKRNFSKYAEYSRFSNLMKFLDNNDMGVQL